MDTTGQRLTGLLALLLGAACSANGTDVAVESASGALAAGTVVTYEAETLARTASATGSQVTSETGASAGQYVQLSQSAPLTGSGCAGRSRARRRPSGPAPRRRRRART